MLSIQFIVFKDKLPASILHLQTCNLIPNCLIIALTMNHTFISLFLLSYLTYMKKYYFIRFSVTLFTLTFSYVNNRRCLPYIYFHLFDDTCSILILLQYCTISSFTIINQDTYPIVTCPTNIPSHAYTSK